MALMDQPNVFQPTILIETPASMLSKAPAYRAPAIAPGKNYQQMVADHNQKRRAAPKKKAAPKPAPPPRVGMPPPAVVEALTSAPKSTAVRHRTKSVKHIGFGRRDIARLAMRAGMVRISKNMIGHTATLATRFLADTIRGALEMTLYQKKKTITTSAIIYALKVKGIKYYPTGDKITREKSAPPKSLGGRIKLYQTSTGLLCLCAPFARLVKKLTQKASDFYGVDFGVHFGRDAISNLQEATEQYLVSLLRDASRCTVHAHRKTANREDVLLADMIRCMGMPNICEDPLKHGPYCACKNMCEEPDCACKAK